MEAVLDFTRLLEKKRKPTRRWGWALYITFLLGCLFFSSITRADDLKINLSELRLDTPCAPEVPEPRRAKLSYEETDGYWFQEDIAKCMLARLSILPDLSVHLSLLEVRKNSTDDVISLQKETVRLANEAREEAQGALDSAIREKRRAEDRLNHWTRSPWLWFSVGVITTVGIMVGSSFLLDSVRK